MKKHKKKNKAHQYKKPLETKKSSSVVRNSLFLILIVGLFFFSMYGYRCLVEKVCESEAITKYMRHDTVLTMPKGTIKVEVANTKASRELGLSGRKEMKKDEGILFVFDTPGRYGFWMKDMQFPLDIVWINQNGVVVSLERNLTPESYPKTFINEVEASYVLELNAGLSEKLGLYLGSKVKIGELPK